MKTIEQSLKRNGPLDAQGIEMRLVRGGGGGGGGGGGERVLSASGPIQNAFVGSIALFYFGRPLKPPQILKRNRPLDVQGIE